MTQADEFRTMHAHARKVCKLQHPEVKKLLNALMHLSKIGAGPELFAMVQHNYEVVLATHECLRKPPPPPCDLEIVIVQ
jgi:hypothetical protein